MVVIVVRRGFKVKHLLIHKLMVTIVLVVINFLATIELLVVISNRKVIAVSNIGTTIVAAGAKRISSLRMGFTNNTATATTVTITIISARVKMKLVAMN